MFRYFQLGILLQLIQPGGIISQKTHNVPPKIRLWYGNHQSFGQLGTPQRWVNILGNVSSSTQVRNTVYTLSGQDPKPFNLGPDLHRLAMPGDFNIQLGWDELTEGINQLNIDVTTRAGKSIQKEVEILISKGKNWPLPYSIDFSDVNNPQQIVQVVDGEWVSTESGIHTKTPYYDRVLSIGDTTWQDYQTLIELTIHGWTPSQPGPPTYNVSHFGIAQRWRGHHIDGKQPSRKWYPLGAQGELLLKENLDSCQWRILFDGGNAGKKPLYSSKRRAIVIEKRMNVKAEVKTLPDGSTRYRYKHWTADHPEPEDWDVVGIEFDDYPSGALCLVPHNSDVTIHRVAISPLP